MKKKTRKENNVHTYLEKRNKIYNVCSDMKVYVENPKACTKNSWFAKK